MTQDDTTKTRICAFEDVPEDDGLRIEIPGHPPLAVWAVDGTAWVTDDTCTHGQASLVEGGMLDGFVIECGLHLGAFDIRDGSVASAPCTQPLQVYPTVVTDGEVYAELSAE